MKRNHIIQAIILLFSAVFLFGCTPKEDITCDDIVTIEVNTTLNPNNVCTALDDVGNPLVVLDDQITISDTFDPTVLGTYEITLKIDTEHRTYNFDMVVHVVDTTSPVITLEGENNIKIGVGSIYVDAGATAQDNLDGPVRVTIDTSDVDIKTFGVYYVIFTATDNQGNTKTEQRIVEVGDVNPPYVDMAPKQYYYGGGLIDYEEYINWITDDYSDEFLIEIDDSAVDLFVVGDYPVIYSVQDGAGNTTTRIMTLSVQRPYIITPEVSLEWLPGGFSFTILNWSDVMEHVSVTITIKDETSFKPVEGLVDLAYTGDPLLFEDVVLGQSYGYVLSFEMVEDPHDRVHQTEQQYSYFVPEHVFQEKWFVEPYVDIVNLNLPLSSEQASLIERVDVIEDETDTIVQSYERSPGIDFQIRYLTAGTAYRIEYVFTNGWVDSLLFETKVPHQEDTVTLRFHYEDPDGDFTGSGVMIVNTTLGETRTLPLTGIDEFGGYVEWEVSLDDEFLFTEQLEIRFFADIIHLFPYIYGFKTVNTLPFIQRAEQRVDYYLYSNQYDDMYVVPEGYQLLQLHYIDYGTFTNQEIMSHIGSVHFIDRYPDDEYYFPLYGDPFVSRTMLVNGVDVPYVTAPIVVPNTAQYVYFRTLPIDAMTDYVDFIVDVSDMTMDPIQNQYIVLQESPDTVSEETFLEALQNEGVVMTYYNINYRYIGSFNDRVFIRFGDDLGYDVVRDISIDLYDQDGTFLMELVNEFDLDFTGDTFLAIHVPYDLRDDVEMVSFVDDDPNKPTRYILSEYYWSTILEEAGSGQLIIPGIEGSIPVAIEDGKKMIYYLQYNINGELEMAPYPISRMAYYAVGLDQSGYYDIVVHFLIHGIEYTWTIEDISVSN